MGHTSCYRQPLVPSIFLFQYILLKALTGKLPLIFRQFYIKYGREEKGGKIGALILQTKDKSL